MLESTPELAPRTAGFVRAWISALYDRGGRRTPFVDDPRASPFLDVLLPAVFEIDGVGAALNDGYWGTTSWNPQAAVPEAVLLLIAEGRLDRAVILAAVRDRLVRGDRPAWLRPFTAIHEGLAPAVAELVPAVGDYSSLLAGGPGPVAALAQRALRAVDDAGLLEFDVLVDAGAAALQRGEKGLVKAQLSWLDRVARRDAGRVGAVMETVAVAFGHPALDVQEQALGLIGRRAGDLDAATVARIADAASVLAGDLPIRAAELLGVVEAPAATPRLAPPAPAAVMPPPITSGAELAGEIAALMHGETSVTWERVIAGLVSLPDLAEPLGPILERYEYDPGYRYRFGQSTATGVLGDVIKAIVLPAERHEWSFDTRAESPLRGGAAGALVFRLRELTDRIGRRPVPLLLATPTRVDGTLDAADLLERLVRAEADGWTPWPVDFEQALLRMSPAADHEVTRRAAELTSECGRRFAAWLREGGAAGPVSTRVEQSGAPWYGGAARFQRRVVVRLDPAPSIAAASAVGGAAAGATDEAVRDGGWSSSVLAEGLFTLACGDVASYYSRESVGPADIAVAALPHHREVVAAWALPSLAALADLDQRGAGRLLPLLAEASGPIGPAMALALAYVLGARDEADRLAAVDAFLILAGREDVADRLAAVDVFPVPAAREGVADRLAAVEVFPVPAAREGVAGHGGVGTVVGRGGSRVGSGR
ncbi:hypothetical protein [Actinoplanes sp. G11-F43]|uniref:hypothetical protein n=1 Tax=Actinoplanes sp. G11-F43 TaxID=3424130 RepID=UPI003D33E1F0